MIRPVLALAALSLALAACNVTSERKPAVSVRLRATPADTVVAGDSLHMKAWVINDTNQPLTLEFETQCQLELFVVAPDRTILHPPGGGATCISTPTTLQVPANDSVHVEESWLASSPMTGEYTAYGVLSSHDAVRGERRESKNSHRSNIVIFHVVHPRS